MNRLKILVYFIFLFNTVPAQVSIDSICQGSASKPLLPNNRLTCIYNYCNMHLDENPKQIKSILERVRPFIEQYKLENRKTEYFYLYGSVYLNLEMYDSAKFYFEKSLTLVSDEQVALAFKLNSNLGISYRRQNKYADAIAHFNRAMQNAKQANNKQREAIIYNELGKLYTQQEQYSDAISNFQKAINGFKDRKDTLNVADVYTNIANLYRHTGNNPLAMDYLQKARNIYSKLNDNKGLGMIYMNMGQVYSSMTNYEQAEIQLQKANEIYKAVDIKLYLAKSFHALGNVKLKLDKLDESMYCLNRAYNIYDKLKDNVGVVKVLTDIGKYYQEIKRFETAQEYFLKSLKKSNSLNTPFYRMQLYELLSQSYAVTKNYENAYKYRLRYEKAYNEKLIVENNREHILLRSKLQLKEDEVAAFKFEQAQKENSLNQKINKYRILLVLLLIASLVVNIWVYVRLNKKLKVKGLIIKQKTSSNIAQNDLMKKLQQKIATLTKTKERYFLVATKNIVEPVESLRRLTSKLVGTTSTAQDQQLLQYMHTNKDAIAMAYNLVENILYWSRQQQGKVDYEPDICNIQALIESVVSFQKIRAEAKNVNIKIINNERFEAYVDKKMIEVALRNIIENAIKFSTWGSTVEIHSKKAADKLSIKIVDKGVGMAKEQVARLEQADKVDAAIGTHGEKGGGIDYLLASDFIKRNFGKIIVKSSIAEGTAVEVILPGSNEKLT